MTLPQGENPSLFFLDATNFTMPHANMDTKVPPMITPLMPLLKTSLISDLAFGRLKVVTFYKEVKWAWARLHYSFRRKRKIHLGSLESHLDKSTAFCTNTCGTFSHFWILHVGQPLKKSVIQHFFVKVKVPFNLCRFYRYLPLLKKLSALAVWRRITHTLAGPRALLPNKTLLIFKTNKKESKIVGAELFDSQRRPWIIKWNQNGMTLSGIVLHPITFGWYVIAFIWCPWSYASSVSSREWGKSLWLLAPCTLSLLCSISNNYWSKWKTNPFSILGAF